MVTALTEDQIQAKFYQTTYNQYPQIRGLLFSVPNGSTRHPLEAMKLKATGLTPGIPDMIFLWNGKAYGIEFKTETGTLQPAQRQIHTTWESNGIPVIVARSVDDALNFVKSILNQ